MKRLFVLLSGIASISSVYADRSISLVVQPDNAANILEWDNFSESGNLVSKNIPVNSVFSAFSDNILSEIHQKDGYTAFLHTCVFTKSGETAGHKTFLVLSPTIYEEWDNMVYPLNDVPDACEWTLNFSDIPWKIKRIELDAVNYGMINPHDNGKYSSGIIVLNGKEQVLDKNSDLTILGFDFAEGEREMSKIVLIAPKSASVGISAIRIFPDVENKFIATPVFSGKLEYSAEGVYSLPLPEEGKFHRPELLKTAIFDNTGSIMSCNCRYSENNQFTFSAGEDFAPIQEGIYGICSIMMTATTNRWLKMAYLSALLLRLPDSRSTSLKSIQKIVL
ncbi:MAG: hypothetical protein K2K29_07080 [Muribaculaceae bacterium]|nr:hypothetical protein [Muribaculaceae bacterium]